MFKAKSKAVRFLSVCLAAILIVSACICGASAKNPDYRWNVRFEDYPYSSDAVVYLGTGECYNIGVDHHYEGVEFFDLLAEGNNVKLLFSRRVDSEYSFARVKAHGTPNNTGDYVGVVSNKYANGVYRDSLYGNKCALYRIFKVRPAPKSVSLNKKSVKIKVGQRYSLYESTNSGSYANPQNITWRSTNNAIATASRGWKNEGIIVGKKKGVVNITVRTYNGKTATCKVTVV